MTRLLIPLQKKLGMLWPLLLLTVLLQLALPALAQWAAPPSPPAIQLVDDRQATVTFKTSPQRIVSLLPSLTESVCALGQCQRLVGVDRYSNYPASVKKLPQLGGGMDPNLEAIVALKPDVVLLAVSSRLHVRLAALGIPVLALETETHADVQRVLATLGQLLGIAPQLGADRLWREIDAAISAQAQALPPQARKLRVYFEVNSGPYAAGEASFMGQTLARLGAVNIVTRALGPFPKLNPEFVVQADPDVIMVGQSDAAGLRSRPGWAAMRAIATGRVCVFKPEDSDVLVRPGPRMALAARMMAQCLAANAGAATAVPPPSPGKPPFKAPVKEPLKTPS